MKFSLASLKSLSFFKKSEGLLGIDLGTFAIKLVRLERQGNGWTLAHWGVIPYGQDLPIDTPLAERRVQAVEALQAYLQSEQISQKRVASSVSGNSVIVRYVKINKMTPTELRGSIKFEAEPYIPFNIDDVNLSFFILGDVLEEGQPQMETVLVAAKKDAIEARVELLREAGLEPVILDVDAFALETAYEMAAPGAAETILFMNIGANTTNMSIVEKGVSRVVRDVFIAGNSFTKAVQRQLQCDPKTAEEKKIGWGLADGAADPEGLQINEALVPVAQDLVGEVKRSIDFYLSQGADRSVQKILLCGGSANLKTLDHYLTRELNIPTEIFNPFASFPVEVPEDRRSHLPMMAVAAGIACRMEGDASA